MSALRKGQASAFSVTNAIGGEARIVERAFGLGACPGGPREGYDGAKRKRDSKVHDRWL
jgi:hypothetical protein